jgi:surfactin synthase thioesterase subunit
MIAKMQVSPHKWLTCFQPRPSADINLVCFPFGGASASAYKQLTAQLPENVQVWSVQLPGRENRFAEPFATNPVKVVQSVSDEIRLLRLENIVFFGHSMGSDLALLCTALRHQGGYGWPLLLAVSGNKPPHLPNTRAWSAESDEALLEYVLGLGGIPAEVAADQDFAGMYLEKMRADYVLYESIPADIQKPLDVPLLVVHASDDPVLKDVDMQSWLSYSTRTPTMRTVGGGHFYFLSDASELAGIIGQALQGITASSRPVSA